MRKKNKVVVDSSVIVKWINSQEEKNLDKADKLLKDCEKGLTIILKSRITGENHFFRDFFNGLFGRGTVGYLSTSCDDLEYAMNNHNYEFTVINDTLRSSTQLAFRYGPYFHYEGIGNVSNLAYCKYLKTANTYYMYNNRYNDGKGSPSIAHVPYILKYPFIVV